VFISLESESSKTEMEGCSKMIPTSILKTKGTNWLVADGIFNFLPSLQKREARLN